MDYLPLARTLGGVRTVVGVPCRTLHDPAHRDVSLEAMAEAYVQGLRATQSTGPYHLLGWSLGGAIAAHMAAHLEASGESVAFVGLVDPMVPSEHAPRVIEPDWRRDFIGLLRDLDPLLDSAVRVPDDVTDPLQEESPLCAWTISLHRAGSFRPRGRYVDVAPANVVRIFLVDRCMTALIRHQPRPLPVVAAPVTCWWANDQLPEVIAAAARQLAAPTHVDRFLDATHADIVHCQAFLGDPLWLAADRNRTVSP
jgi:thioesterase domain-containing protein